MIVYSVIEQEVIIHISAIHQITENSMLPYPVGHYGA